MTASKYVDATAVADYFGVSRASIFNRITEGTIPSGAYLRIGRVFRFDLDAVEKALLQASAQTPVEVQLEFDFDVDAEDTTQTEELENDYGN